MSNLINELNFKINTLHKYVTEFNADSIEWCPHEPFKNYFVCANYQLNDAAEGDTVKRLGRIMLFSILKEELKLHQTIDTDGVLDQKWCPNKINGLLMLGVATATKEVVLYELNQELIQLEYFVRLEIEAPNVSELLILSLDWSTCKYFSTEPEVVCSDSKGNVHKFKLSNTKLNLVSTWNAHSFEAWIAAFYYWDPNIIFTGGDDSALRKYDHRISCKPISTHYSDAGVTSIHSNVHKEHILVTGSYDTNVRLWDARRMKQCVYDIKMQGPVWRLKWDPFVGNEIIAACMLEGVHILSLSDDGLKVRASYGEHENIAYGVDWSFMIKDDFDMLGMSGDKIIASCSFYDRLLCVSNYCKDDE